MHAALVRRQPVAFWAALFLFLGAARQVRADPAVRLAARRDGRPDAGLRAHPRRHHGHRRRLPGRAACRCSSRWRRRRWRWSPIVGALTALFAAIIGFAQNDIKKVLAYSTVSQLGFMFVGRRHRRLRRRHLPPGHPRLLQGLPVPRRRLGDARDERLGRHHHDGRPAQEAAVDARRVPRLLPRDLPASRSFSGFFSKDEILAGAFATERLRRTTWPGCGKLVGVHADRWRRWARRSTCGASTSWCSRATRRAPTTRPSTTSTSRRASMTVPLVVLAVGAALRRLHRPARHGLCRPPRAANLLGAPPRAGAGRASCEVPHNIEIGVHGRLDAAGGWSASRSPTSSTAAATREPARRVRRRGPRLRPPGAGQVLLRRALRRRDHPPDQGRRARPVPGRRPDHHRHDPGRRHRRARRRVRAARADVQNGEVQRYLAVFAVGVALLVYFASQPTLPFSKLKVTQTGRGGRGRRPPRPAARRPGRSNTTSTSATDARSSRARPREQRHDYDRPGSYTIRVTITDPRWGTEDDLKEKCRGASDGPARLDHVASPARRRPGHARAARGGGDSPRPRPADGDRHLPRVAADPARLRRRARPASSSCSTRSGSPRSASTSTWASTASRSGWSC